MKNLKKFKVQELDTNELVAIDGGSLWKLIKETAAGILIEEGLRALGGAIVDHMNSGGGYGGHMDTHGKL